MWRVFTLQDGFVLSHDQHLHLEATREVSQWERVQSGSCTCVQIDGIFSKDKYDYSRFTNECYGGKQGIKAVKRITIKGSVKIVIEL